MGQSQTHITREKISLARMGKNHEHTTKFKIQNARTNQNPQPNYKLGKYSSQAKRKNRIDRMEKLLIKLIGNDLASIPPDNQNELDEISIYTLLVSLIDTETNALWLKKTIKDISLDFSIKEVDKKADELVKKIVKSKKKEGENSKLYKKAISRAKMLVGVYFDVAQSIQGRRKDSDIRKHNVATRYWKCLIKLDCALNTLGIRNKRDARLYVKGVISRAVLPKGQNVAPIGRITDPIYVLDYLHYLKTDWYDRHGTRSKEAELEYRNKEFGKSYHIDTMSDALGLLHTLLRDHKDSIFGAELLTMLSENNISDYYVYYSYFCSQFSKAFWKEGWMQKLNPELSKKITLLDREMKYNTELQELATLAKTMANEMRQKTSLPKFGTNYNEYIRWATSNPALRREIENWVQLHIA
jgi:hypothetical protein